MIQWKKWDWSLVSRALLSSSLMVLSFPPLSWWPLAIVSALIMLDYFLTQPSAKKLFYFLAFWVFFVNVGGFYWIAYTFHEFGALPYYLSVPIMLSGFVIMGLISFPFSVFFHVLRNQIRRRDWNARWEWAALALTFILWDRFEFRFFPWSVPMAFGADTYLMASVGVFKHTGWIFIFWSFSTALLAMLRAPPSPLKKLWVSGSLTLFFAVVYGVGLYQVRALRKQYPARQPVALLQGNVGNYEKKLTKLGVAPSVENVMAIHQELIERTAIQMSEAVEERGLEPWIVWPETSFPGFPIANPFSKEHMIEWTKLTRGLHLVGAYHSDNRLFHGKETELSFNVVAFFHENFGLVDFYEKQILLPFGEYVPGDEYFENAYEVFQNVNHFGAGKELKLLVHPNPEGPVFIPLVCYEILFPSLLQKFVDRAEREYPGRQIVVVNPTNDSWYGASSEPFQHSLLARWRTASFGLPLLRPANTGFSQVVAPWGEVLSSGPLNDATVIFGELPVKSALHR